MAKGRHRAGWLVLGLTLLSFGVARTLHARVRDIILESGRAVLDARSWLPVGPSPEAVTLNGLTFDVAGGTVPGSLESVTSAFVERCRDGGVVDVDEGVSPRGRGGAPDGTVVVRGEGLAVVACFARAAPLLGAGALLEALARALDTGDLATLGDLRFAVFRERGEAAFVVTVTSTGPLPVAAAFPATGDAPGSDLPDAPRPPGATRILSAGLRGAAPSVVAYSAPDGEGSLVTEQERTLRANGFRIVPVEAREGEGTTFLAVRGERALVVAGALDGSGDGVVLVEQ